MHTVSTEGRDGKLRSKHTITKVIKHMPVEKSEQGAFDIGEWKVCKIDLGLVGGHCCCPYHVNRWQWSERAPFYRELVAGDETQRAQAVAQP